MQRTILILAFVLGCATGTAAQAQDGGSANDRYHALIGLARVKRNAGDMTGARRYFEDARRVRPLERQELTEYFWVLAGRDAAAALAAGRELLTVTPAAHTVRDRVITEAIAVGDELAARSVAAEGERRQPNVAVWPRRIGESYLRQSQPDQAAEAFARAARAPDASVEDRAGLAVALESTKRYAESAAAWRAVPASARTSRMDWENSRLRAIAHGGAPAEAAAELDAWLESHPEDDTARELLVGVWLRAKQPREALAALTPAPAGAAGTPWIRRRLSIAQSARLPDAGVAAIDELVARGAATAEDRRLQVALLAEMKQYDKAASLVRSLAPKSGKCDVQLLTVADRLPHPAGTDLLSGLMTRPGCAAPASWIRRGAERHVAASNHRAALALLKMLPVSELEKPTMARLAGQVHAWTGDLPEAIRLLELAVTIAPDDQAARRTLAEAREALYLPYIAAPTPLTTSAAMPLSDAPPPDRTALPAASNSGQPAGAELKQRAQELAWSGHHAEAIQAYDKYLKVAPDDLDALRLQARVAGWAGQYGLSRRLYADLQARVPGDAALAAEAAAKSAFYDGRWRASTEAYAHWIRLEPRAGEARFEYAESLRADGRVAEADAALEELIAMDRHDQASAALLRARVQRGPSIALVTNGKSADGYEGQRLLDLGEYGGVIRTSFGRDRATTLSAQVTRVRASGDLSARNGYAAGLTGAFALSRTFGIDGRATVWDIASSGKGIVDATARFAWRPVDRWTFAIGGRQDPLFENMTTVDRGLTATGGFAAATFDTTRTWLNLQLARQSVSDGNDRTRATLTISRVLSDRWRHIRVVGWTESLQYKTSSPDYFSPSGQLRADLGLEYTFEIRPPQFRGDRQQTITAGYLIGTDNEGTTYHHPLVRASFEFAPGLAFDAQATWIRSDVYKETSAFIGLRVMGR